MGLEDYFTWDKHKERNPLKITCIHVWDEGEFYKIAISDKEGISVQDPREIEKSAIKEEVDQLCGVLKGRSYVVEVEYLD